MAIIQNLLSGLTGSGDGWDWQAHLRPASFRGVPFGVYEGEGVFGRRQAVHEYPYRDTVWVEDMGRDVRKIAIRGFLVQDSLRYQAGDVLSQRQALIAACETSGSGTLIHPTLGELTVSVPEGGLRVTESMDAARVFEFTLTVIESGLRVFSVTGSTQARDVVSTNWLKLASTTAASFLAQVKGEIRSVSQAIKTVRGVASFWQGMVTDTVSEVTNLSSTLRSTFGSTRYGRYSRGTVGGSASGATGTTDVDDTADTAQLVNITMARSVTARDSITQLASALPAFTSMDDFASQVQAIVLAILNSPGGAEERIRALEKLATADSGQYYATPENASVAASATLLILVLCSGAMAVAGAEANPAGTGDASAIKESVCDQLDAALVMAGDRGDDDSYNALLALRQAFVDAMALKGATGADVMQVSVPAVMPSLVLATRLYQDASRSDELIQETGVRHPAFMPLRFMARKPQ